MPKIVIEKEIEHITVQRGETLTVWLNIGTEKEPDNIQLEVRVMPDGTPETFCSSIAVTMLNFKCWYNMDETKNWVCYQPGYTK